MPEVTVEMLKEGLKGVLNNPGAWENHPYMIGSGTEAVDDWVLLVPEATKLLLDYLASMGCCFPQQVRRYEEREGTTYSTLYVSLKSMLEVKSHD
jgi:hypothetical protein